MSRSLDNYFSYGKVQEGTNYAAGVDTLAENVIEDNEQDAALIYPSKDGWSLLLTDNYRITTENCEAHLPLPIYKINKILLKVSPNAYIGSTAIKIIDFKTKEGKALETLDITKYVVTSDEWNALEIAKSKNGYVNGIYKDNTFYWEKGSKKIPFLSTVYTRGTTIAGGIFADETPTYRRLIVSALATLEKEYEYVRTSATGELQTVYLTQLVKSLESPAETIDFTDVRTWQFRIEYIPLTSAYKMRARKADFGKLDYMQPFNQRAEINSSSAFGKNMFYTAQKTGVSVVSVTKNYQYWADIPNVGDLVKHRGNVYRLVANEYKLTNHLYLQVTHILSENWTNKSKHIAVNQKYRNYNIPQDTLWRNLHWENFAMLSFEPPSTEPAPNDLPNNTELNCMAKNNGVAVHAFKCLDYRWNSHNAEQLWDDVYNDDQQINFLCWQFNESKEEDKYQAVCVPCSTYGMANSIIISAQFKDQLSAGLRRIKIDDKDYCEETYYCETDGTLEKAKVMLTEGLSPYATKNEEGFFLISEKYQNAGMEVIPASMYNYDASDTDYDSIILNYPDGIMFNETFNIKKDKGEALKFTYQMHFIPKSPDIIIGKALTERNTLIHKDENAGVQTNNGKWRKFNVWFSYVPFRQGEDKISKIISNNDTTVRWTDVDGYSDVKDRKFTFELLNSGVGAWYGQTVAKFGLSQHEYDYYVLEKGYKYWAIADEQNNLFFACNRENTQYIYGWVADKLYRPYDYEHNQYLDNFFSGNESGGEGGGEEDDIPSYWKKLEYIESTGNQWIDTLEYLTDTTDIEFVGSITENTKTGWIAGAPTWVGIHKKVGGVAVTQTSSGMVYTNVEVNKDFKISLIGNKSYFNDVEVSTLARKNSTSSLFLFAYHHTNETGTINTSIRLKSFKMWRDNILIRDFVPLLDETNRPFLYDKVNKQTFYNFGSVEFNYELL